MMSGCARHRLVLWGGMRYVCVCVRAYVCVCVHA